jgi:Ni/Fe-hydrogenase subunit HybB-like protein
MSEHAPVGGRLITKPFSILVLLAMLAFAILIARFLFGLGSVTAMSDGYPWGIWIVIDVMIGTAFGCAGYSVALLVYVMNKGEYHPLVRPAVMAGLFGYTLGGIAVMIDLGRYWQFWTLLWPGYVNLNSVMLEVAWCVMAYIVVLWIEFTPAFLERLGFNNLKEKLSKVLFLIIAIGVLLPTMHQSSLGTLATAVGFKISPLWQTQMVPLLFLLSAVVMGYAIVPFESILSALGLKRPFETKLLGKLTVAMLIVLVAYLVVRVIDLTWRGAWGYAFELNTQAIMFWVEMALFVAPVLMLITQKNMYDPRLQFLSGFSLLLAGSVYRINTYIIGFDAGPGWSYFPSAGEIMVTVGVFSFEVILYLFFVKKLPVLHRAEAH